MAKFKNTSKITITGTFDGKDYILPPGGVSEIPTGNKYIANLITQGYLQPVLEPAPVVAEPAKGGKQAVVSEPPTPAN